MKSYFYDILSKIFKYFSSPAPEIEETNLISPKKEEIIVQTQIKKELLDVTKIHPHSQYKIHCLLILHDGRLSSVSSDSRIKVFNLNDYSCDLILRGMEI